MEARLPPHDETLDSGTRILAHPQFLEGDAPRARSPRDRAQFIRAGFDVSLLLGPALVLLIVFVVVPLVVVAILAFFTYNPLSGTGRFVGLTNYRRVLASTEYRTAAVNTAEYFILTVPLTLVLGLSAALGIHRLGSGGQVWRVIYFLPVASTLAATSVVWRWLFYPRTGVIDATIGRLLGVTDWLHSSRLVIPAIALVGIWEGIGFAVVIFLAGLNGVPAGPLEAARLDGAGAWSRFWHITLPSLSPALMFNLVLSTRNALRVYDEVRVMTGGGPADRSNTLAFLIWKRGIQFLDVGGGAVITITLLALILLMTALQFALGGSRIEGAGTQ